MIDGLFKCHVNVKITLTVLEEDAETGELFFLFIHYAYDDKLSFAAKAVATEY